ncbi:sugar isomerase (SIS) [Coriobacterium glomerans PW2]|uniref:Sugar isomerase (SIS) n=1 Tax=Coriobacterium glomerans (strain ATCC 49209 / DSM 20642 / JCM 10262 / PW2) TaxID=700015 RepID=F2NAX3_CORGP|nr:SIS domain-containing protein [Coriobacterium glomerans]AEB07651.1 sugar isomerase (SIS) [Coriobacterium glomerans PW2]
MSDTELNTTDRNEVEEFLSIARREISAFAERIDYNQLSSAKLLIREAERAGCRVHVTGIGKPAHVAGYVASLFSSTGTPAYELHGTEAVHGSSGQVRPGDIVIAISNSGETAELKATVSTLIANGAHIISVTGNPSSWLARVGEVELIASVSQEGDYMNKPPRVSVLAEIIELQCLSILLQRAYGLTPQSYVTWHPGGSLGQSIRSTEDSLT